MLYLPDPDQGHLLDWPALLDSPALLHLPHQHDMSHLPMPVLPDWTILLLLLARSIPTSPS